MRLSIVSTLYRSAATLEEFHRRASAAAAALTPDYEIVLVVDGSPDDSRARALALQEQDPRLVVVDLSRNFGHHPAMMAGLAQAGGDLIFLIDSDLEEAPEWLTEFEQVRVARGADVVYGVQTTRAGAPIDRFSAWLFYGTINLIFDHPIPRNVLTVRLMTRRYVRALLRHRERLFAIAGLWVITGFDQVAVPVTKSRRLRPAYRFTDRVSVLVRAVTSFSGRPLVYIFYLGLAISAVSFLMITYFTLDWLIGGRFLEGWLSVVLSIWLLGGITIFCVGLVGIYVSHIFVEAKRRPLVVIRGVHRRPAPGEPDRDGRP